MWYYDTTGTWCKILFVQMAQKEYINLLPTKSEEREVLGVGSIPHYKLLHYNSIKGPSINYVRIKGGVGGSTLMHTNAYKGGGGV